MSNNFNLGIKANIADIRLFMTNILHNTSLLGFFFGIFVTVLIIGFIITKNPRSIPVILRYSSMDAFQKITKQDKNGTYQMAFSKFVKIYTQLRTLFLIMIISFFVMITTIVLTK